MFSAMIYVCNKICKYSSHGRHSKWDNEERRKKRCQFLPFHPRALKDLTRHFSFLRLCFPDLIQLLKLVFFCFCKNK